MRESSLSSSNSAHSGSQAVGDILNSGFINKAAERWREMKEYGIPTCPKCGCAEFAEREYNGVMVVLPVTCRCDDALAKKEEAARKAAAVDALRKNCFTAGSYIGYTFESCDERNPKEVNAAKAYVENFAAFAAEGRGLLLFGDVGGGKTYIAASIANALMEKGRRVIMRTVSDLIYAMQDRGNPLASSMMGCDLLIIDDYGAERDTEWSKEGLYRVVDGRYASRRPMLISTNLTTGELASAAMMDRRINDRLLERCRPIRIPVVKRRVSRANYEEMDKILGLE